MLLRNQLYKQQYDSTRCVKVSHSLSKYGTASSFYDARPTFPLHNITLKYNSKCQYNICCSVSLKFTLLTYFYNKPNERKHKVTMQYTHAHTAHTEQAVFLVPWMCGVWRIV